LKEAEAEERKAYREAERNGWTKTELNKLKPTKRRRTSQQKRDISVSDNKTQTPSEITAAVTPQASEATPVGSVGQSSVRGNV